MRPKRWKLTWYPETDRYQLFDLEGDPLELVDLLAGWRRRRRLAIDAGERVWQKDRWAARDPRPTYSQVQIDGVVKELHARLISQMQRHGDPLLEDRMPPQPA